jgi:hypothetical protein
VKIFGSVGGISKPSLKKAYRTLELRVTLLYKASKPSHWQGEAEEEGSQQFTNIRGEGRGKSMSFRWYYPDQVQRCFSDRVMPKQSSNTRHAVTKTYVVQLFPDAKDQILYSFPPPYRPRHPRKITNFTRSLFLVFSWTVESSN